MRGGQLSHRPPLRCAITPPRDFVAPVADGGVQLEWDGPGGHLEVEIDHHALLSYLLVQDGPHGRSFEERHDVSAW
jgi:hypothetical protein